MNADLLGYRTLNLLNANGDPSLMSSVLYAHIAAPHLPVPKASFCWSSTPCTSGHAVRP